MSCTTSWPSRQVSGRHRNTSFQALWGLSTGLDLVSQTLPWVYTNMGLLTGMRICPIMLWGLLLVGRPRPWESPGPEALVQVSSLFVGKSQVVCGQPEVEVFCSSLGLSICPLSIFQSWSWLMPSRALAAAAFKA